MESPKLDVVLQLRPHQWVLNRVQESLPLICEWCSNFTAPCAIGLLLLKKPQNKKAHCWLVFSLIRFNFHCDLPWVKSELQKGVCDQMLFSGIVYAQWGQLIAHALHSWREHGTSASERSWMPVRSEPASRLYASDCFHAVLDWVPLLLLPSSNLFTCPWIDRDAEGWLEKSLDNAWPMVYWLEHYTGVLERCKLKLPGLLLSGWVPWLSAIGAKTQEGFPLYDMNESGCLYMSYWACPVAVRTFTPPYWARLHKTMHSNHNAAQ